MKIKDRLTRETGDRLIKQKANWRCMDWEHLGEWSSSAADYVCEQVLRKCGYDDLRDLDRYFAGYPEVVSEFECRSSYEITSSLSKFVMLRRLKPGKDQFGRIDGADDRKHNRAFVYWREVDRYAIVKRVGKDVVLVRTVTGNSDMFFLKDDLSEQELTEANKGELEA